MSCATMPPLGSLGKLQCLPQTPAFAQHNDKAMRWLLQAPTPLILALPSAWTTSTLFLSNSSAASRCCFSHINYGKKYDLKARK